MGFLRGRTQALVQARFFRAPPDTRDQMKAGQGETDAGEMD